MSLDPGLDFQVDRGDYRKFRFVESPAPDPLAQGQVLFRVDRFALTANNISYANAGDMLRYWDFFPAEEGWGRIPAMGFGDVVASAHPEVTVGLRCFGFFPMSRYLVIEPEAVSAARISDGAAHRKGIAQTYNNYSPVHSDPAYEPAHEDAHMLMRGLFLTSFLADDFLAESDHFGASSVLISSASSKTSIALAHLVRAREGLSSVGLTSARNIDFVRGLSLYDEVLLYDDIASLPAERPSVLVDMAGSGTVTGAVHRHFRDALRYSCSIGATHWEAPRRDAELPGPTPAFFFAPSQIQKRAQDWGAEGLEARIGASWAEFRDASAAWLKVVRSAGRDAMERAYRETLEGATPPSEGQVLSLWGDA